MTAVMPKISGRVWVLGDNVDTDAMAPGVSLLLEWPERREHMFPQHQDFINLTTPGDIIIAGENFGCGSSREQAVHNLKHLEIALVAARSFSRIFFRNAVANALPAVQCTQLGGLFSTGNVAELNWETSALVNKTTGQSTSFTPYTEQMMEIILAGGLIKKLKSLKCSKISPDQQFT